MPLTSTAIMAATSRRWMSQAIPPTVMWVMNPNSHRITSIATMPQNICFSFRVAPARWRPDASPHGPPTNRQPYEPLNAKLLYRHLVSYRLHAVNVVGEQGGQGLFGR